MKLVLYTSDEVVRDIEKFESVSNLRLPTQTTSRFVKMYSEHYDAPIPKGSPTSAIVERIEQYLGDSSVHLMAPDVIPDIVEGGPDRWMYGFDEETGRSTLLITYRENEKNDDLSNLFKSDEFQKWKFLLNVHVDLGTMSSLTLSRPTH